MLTSKQRAYLRGLANAMDAIVHVGKSGLADTTVKQTDDALTARELIKGKVLETAPEVGAEVVMTIGRTFVLYRRHPEEPVIMLPRK